MTNLIDAVKSGTMTLDQALRASEARANQGAWVPASNQTEVPFVTRSGHKLLYCYQASTGRHGYLNCETDMILSDEEAAQALALF